MSQLLDSDVVIDLRDSDPRTVRLVNELTPAGVAMSIITYMEAYQGLVRRPDQREAEAIMRRLVDGIPVLHLTYAVARRCARLRESLRVQGRRVTSRSMDLIIAATALEHGLTLVTCNTDDYRDIPGLKLQAVT